jgi:hypothetical protein
VYNPDWHTNMREVSDAPLIVGPEPQFLPFTVDSLTGIDAAEDDPSTAPLPPLRWVELATTAAVTAALSLSVAWVLFRPRPGAKHATSPLPPGDGHTDASIKLPTTSMSGSSAGSDGPTSGSGGVEASVGGVGGGGGFGRLASKEVPIEGGEKNGAIRLGKIDVHLNRLLGRGR